MRGGGVAAAVLGASHPRAGGLRRPRPVLPVEPGEARPRGAAGGLAVFLDPPGYPGGAVRGVG